MISVADTVADTPSTVCISPCTIHGCRPLSVSTQPAVLTMSGNGTSQTAIERKTRDVGSFLRAASQMPQSANRKMSVPP